MKSGASAKEVGCERKGSRVRTQTRSSASANKVGRELEKNGNKLLREHKQGRTAFAIVAGNARCLSHAIVAAKILLLLQLLRRMRIAADSLLLSPP
jgi:hypothetical protein